MIIFYLIRFKTVTEKVGGAGVEEEGGGARGKVMGGDEWTTSKAQSSLIWTKNYEVKQVLHLIFRVHRQFYCRCFPYESLRCRHWQGTGDKKCGESVKQEDISLLLKSNLGESEKQMATSEANVGTGMKERNYNRIQQWESWRRWLRSW